MSYRVVPIDARVSWADTQPEPSTDDAPVVTRDVAKEGVMYRKTGVPTDTRI